MKKTICPKCARFAMDFHPNYKFGKDYYVCEGCGYEVEAADFNPTLNESSVQRFPTGVDSEPTSNLDKFMKGKKQ
ncbi:MAG: hypothetical protein K5694_00955 [Bacilli bacterium]|nr:hypothetical protein [Bacilli bacterium]